MKTTQYIKKYFKRVSFLQFYLGELLLVMGLLQIASFSDFTRAIESYALPIVPPVITALVLILLELIAGIGLLRYKRTWHRITAKAGLVVAVTWSLIAVQAFIRNIVVENCGCFGSYFPQSLSWFVLLQDVIFVAAAFIVYHRVHNEKH